MQEYDDVVIVVTTQSVHLIKEKRCFGSVRECEEKINSTKAGDKDV